MNMVYKKTLASYRGFTLIEVLVAMVIVATALFAVTSKVSLAARIAGQSQQSTYGRWVAMNAITELRLKPGLPETGRSDGDEEMAGVQWRWSMDISNTPVEGLRRVDVDVAHNDSPERVIFKMSAFVGTNNPAAQLRPWSGIPGGDSREPGGQVNPSSLPTNPLPLPNRPNPREGFDGGRN